jgi:fermentation-respiration switch protein FrsA (DUF1100 family)
MKFTLLPSRKLSWKRRLGEYLLVLPLIYLIYLTVLYFVQDRYVFMPSLAGPARPAGQLPPGVESIWLDVGTDAKPARVEAWYAPAPGASPEHPAPAVIYCHGNAELIDTALDHIRGWRKRGYSVLAVEYRGYGRSGGSPSETSLTADAQRFYDTLAARPEIDPSRIIVHGRSLGGGVATALAGSRPAAALVLESSFTSAASFTWQLGAPPFLCRHPFHNDRVLKMLDRPVLLIHGRDDEIIPVAHARRLHEIARQSSLAILPGHHNDFPTDPDAYWAAVDAFRAERGLP